MKLALFFMALTGCKEDCVHMCQKIETWLTDCGLTWEDKFGDQGLASIDDCYDDYAEADDSDDKTCRTRADDYDKKSCW